METVNLTIRIPSELHDQLRERAKQEDRTLASLIRVLLAQAIEPQHGSSFNPRMTPHEADALSYAMHHNIVGVPLQDIDPAAVKAWAESRQR